MQPESAEGLFQVGHSDLGGYGDGMQLMRRGDVLYVGHLGTSGMGTSILDVSVRTDPTVVRQWRPPRGTHSHKVQVAQDLLLVNHEVFESDQGESTGMAVYSLDDPYDPSRIGYFDSTGGGVHRIVWEGGRYAYVSATPDGFEDRIWMIVDLADPEHPVEVGRWWLPGMHADEVADWSGDEVHSVHHALVDGNRAYVGFWDAGMVILDIEDVAAPRVVSRINWDDGAHTHTCLPLPTRDLVVVTDEAVDDGCDGPPHMVRIVDVADEEHPEVISICPVPEGDFCNRGLRFGAHNLHENRPDSYRSEEIAVVTYFNAGLRIYDIADAAAPVEIAHWIPECPAGQQAVQINDVWVDVDLTFYVSDRIGGGIYILEPDSQLRGRMVEAAL